MALVASPLFLHENQHDAPKQRDIFARTALQPDGLSRFTANPIIFVKGQDSVQSAVTPQNIYKILDDEKLGLTSEVTKVSKERPIIGPIAPPSFSKNGSNSDNLAEPPQQEALHLGMIPTTWPPTLSIRDIGRGLDNAGNTCFLNSVLQCLLHTPPLLRVVWDHKQAGPCKVAGFCMTCAFFETATTVFATNGQQSYVRPTTILNNMGKFAKGLRRGRQEDSHEFLRYSIDAFQRAALFGTDPKLPHRVKETTWVHKLFGGRLRSRVTCQVCKHNSDTFDSLLDLSIDVRNKDSVQDALDAFVQRERLAGDDKYNCDICKKHVVAVKQFTIHDAPQVLTVHLKRFTPMGRKLTNPVGYRETMSLAKYMSDGQFGPKYDLYGVISHAGSGPNSGHYYALVKSRTGRWYEMNDESVSGVSKTPLNLKSAYILFYIRQTGEALQSAIHVPYSLAAATEILPTNGGAEKRKRDVAADLDKDDIGVPASLTLESTTTLLSRDLPVHKKAKVEPSHGIDPAAEALQAKMAAHANKERITVSVLTKSALAALAEYGGESSEPEDETLVSSTPIKPFRTSPALILSTPPLIHDSVSSNSIPSTGFLGPGSTQGLVDCSTAEVSSSHIPPASFYENGGGDQRHHRKPGSHGSRVKRRSSDENELGGKSSIQLHSRHHKKQRNRDSLSGMTPNKASILTAGARTRPLNGSQSSLWPSTQNGFWGSTARDRMKKRRSIV